MSTPVDPSKVRPATVPEPRGGQVAAPAPPPVPASPRAGATGLLVVLALAALLGLAGGLQTSLEVLGPVSTFCLPVLAVSALWWGGWPAARAGRVPGGLVSTGLIGAVGVLLTLLGQWVVSGSVAHVFGTGVDTAAGHATSFPFTVPLAAFVFVTMLQLTFVCGQWPLRRLSPVRRGGAALVLSWAVGLGGYLLLATWRTVPEAGRAAMGLRDPGGRVDALDLVAVLLCIAIWQMVVFFLLQGWPVSAIASEPLRLVVANATTVLGGLLTWLVLHDGLGATVETVSAIAGVTVAGTLVVGLLFEGWPARLLGTPGSVRLALLGCAAVVAGVAWVGLHALASGLQTWDRAPEDLWVAVGALNFVGALVIVHVAVWRRWPVRS